MRKTNCRNKNTDCHLLSTLHDQGSVPSTLSTAFLSVFIHTPYASCQHSRLRTELQPQGGASWSNVVRRTQNTDLTVCREAEQVRSHRLFRDHRSHFRNAETERKGGKGTWLYRWQNQEWIITPPLFKKKNLRCISDPTMTPGPYLFLNSGQVVKAVGKTAFLRLKACASSGQPLRWFVAKTTACLWFTRFYGQRWRSFFTCLQAIQLHRG